MIKGKLGTVRYYFGLLLCCFVIFSTLHAAQQLPEDDNTQSQSQQNSTDVDTITQMMRMMHTMMNENREERRQSDERFFNQQERFWQRIENQREQTERTLLAQWLEQIRLRNRDRAKRRHRKEERRRNRVMNRERLRSRLIEEHESRNKEIIRKQVSDAKDAVGAACVGTTLGAVALSVSGPVSWGLAAAIGGAMGLSAGKVSDAASVKISEPDMEAIEQRVRLVYPSSDEYISSDEALSYYGVESDDDEQMQ